MDRSSPMSRGGRSFAPWLGGGGDEDEATTVDEEVVTVDAVPVGPNESFGPMRGPAHFPDMRTDDDVRVLVSWCGLAEGERRKREEDDAECEAGSPMVRP